MTPKIKYHLTLLLCWFIAPAITAIIMPLIPLPLVVRLIIALPIFLLIRYALIMVFGPYLTGE